jgi:hypothetical protein
MSIFMYQLTASDCIRRLPDYLLIPPDPRNREYREYLQWIEAGNEPEPAPVPPAPAVLTPEQKLAAAGLSVPELKTLLGLD